uniref:Uncharacterized protein n=1 Tax=Peromyscus maniculatus bairdii TaxID=230844 RepID=A0A8C8UME9_PERMB
SAGTLAPDFVFPPSPGRGDGTGGQEPGWVDPWSWLSSQGSPAGPGIGPALGPGSEVLGTSPCLLPYELCEGVAYCGSQVGVGLMLQVGLETLQPEGHTGSEWRATWRGPLMIHVLSTPML